jgi:hypothetical protein
MRNRESVSDIAHRDFIPAVRTAGPRAGRAVAKKAAYIEMSDDDE